MATYEATRYTGIVDAGLIVGTSTYVNSSNLPTSNVEVGAMAYVSDTNKLYMWNGTAWFNIAIVNQAPTAITGNQASYVLAKDGTPTVVTLVSTDPEGLPLTWSSSTSGDTQVGTLSQTDNVFTITPSTNEANIGTLSVTFSVTDGNNTETSVSSFILVFLSPYWDETVLSIGTSSTNGLANSTFIDRSTNAHTVTPTGSPVQTAFHPYLDNWSVEFDDNNYLTLDGTVVNNMSSGTFEFWVKVPDLSEKFICAKQINGVGTEGMVSITNYANSAGTRSLGTAGRIYFHPRNGINPAVNNTAITPNIWHHIAVSFSNSQVQFFLDGASDGITLGDYSIPNTTSQPWRIGWWGQASEIGDFKGYLSNFRVSDIVRYSNSFTPVKLSSDNNTLLLTCQSNRFVDNSSNAHTITLTGNVKVSVFNPFGQESEYAVGENKGSGYFDGSGDYLSVPSSTDFAFGTGDFTVEFWYYRTATPSTTDGLVSWNYLSGVHIAENTTGIFLWVGGTQIFQPSTKTVPNSWNHVAVSRSGSTVKLFVNGAEVDSASSSQSVTANALYIGASSHATSEAANGYLSDVRITKGTALYTTNFTPPTAPVTSSNSALYLPMDNAGIFDKTGNNTLIPVGNASTSTTQTKYADTAMYFDGSGDYLETPSSPEVALGTGDFTIEMWYYENSGASGNKAIFDTRSAAGATNGLILQRIDTKNLRVFVNVDVVTTGENTIVQETWQHVAIVKQSGTIRIYLDGVEKDDAASTQDFTNTRLLIGQNANFSQPLNGYIENLQILKGVAKYTANFTVPNRTQGQTYQEES
jgi:hypothetical protein